MAAPPDREMVEEAAHRAARYLARQIRPDGSFIYWRNPALDVPLLPKYNYVRHAGAIWSLLQYRVQFPNAADPGIHRGIRYLEETAIRSVSGDTGTRAVWSDPEVVHGRDQPVAKLGGSGLALASAMDCHQQKCGPIDLDLWRSVGRFVLYMQKPDGSFYSLLRQDPPYRDDRWTSLYYPGEAALGLVGLARETGEQVWRRAAEKALLQLARQRAAADQVPADHWALIATSAIWHELSPEIRKSLGRHALQIVDQILSEHIVDGDPSVRGGFADDGRTTPTATRLEGLIAAMGIPPVFERRAKPIRVVIDAGILFLLRHQHRGGEVDGAMPRASARIARGSRSDWESFNRRSTELRIDYTQHALSAFLGYRSLNFVSD